MKSPRAILIMDDLIYLPHLKLSVNKCEVKSVFVKDYSQIKIVDYNLGIRRTFRYTDYVPSNLTSPFELIIYMTDSPLLSILSTFNKPSRPKDIIILSKLENQYDITLTLAEDEGREYYAIRSINHCVLTTVKARVTQTNSGQVETDKLLAQLIDLCSR